MLLKNYHICYDIKSFDLINTTKRIIFLWTKVGMASSGRAVTMQKSDAESEQMSLAQLCIFQKTEPCMISVPGFDYKNYIIIKLQQKNLKRKLLLFLTALKILKLNISGRTGDLITGNHEKTDQ